ncbi:MAG TPA: heparinase II/III family protein [bacterium]|nr:heparinase II/III family protein [bacterium]HQL62432.1 heparinase II/III family protein [bacterium]
MSFFLRSICSLLIPYLLVAIPHLAACAASSEEYAHPAGYISVKTVLEMRQKYEQYDWAKALIAAKQERYKKWVDQDIDKILRVIPKKRVGVYHLFTCPDSKSTLTFSPFEDDNFVSAKTGKVFRADEFSPVYPKDSPLAGTYYDGWGCYFVIYLADACWQSGILYQVLQEPGYAEWVSRVLLYYADEVAPRLQYDEGYGPRILMYGREGDAIHMNNFVCAYELVRDAGFLTENEKRRIEENFIRYIFEKSILDKEYHEDHNDIPHYLCAIIHAGLAIGEPRYLEFGFGYGDYSPETRSRHRSLAYIARHHFHDDGAHLDRCSGYHLYAATPFYRNLFIGHNLSEMDPAQFPESIFDYFSPDHPLSERVKGVARWASAMCTYDGILPTVGDSMAATASCMLYDPFGEIAYRYCGFKELGLEEKIIRGERPDNALIVGVPQIQTRGIRTHSANLSSGYAVLKQNNMYIALNALQPGGGHQHADRLNLLMYLNDRLMSMEKATPYNDLSLRDQATYSWAHNTVVVDSTTQPQGESLKPEQVPQITQFLDHPQIGVIRAEGDHLYPSTTMYQRTVFRIDNLIVDVFGVEGGKTHDYIYHNYGEQCQVDIPLTEGGPFDISDYLVGGNPTCHCATTKDICRAVWTFPAIPDSVYPMRKLPAAMHLTLLPDSDRETTVFHLLTQYPEQERPLTNTFMARRAGPRNTFVSVFESTVADHSSSVLQAESSSITYSAVKVQISTTDKEIAIVNVSGKNPINQKGFETDAAYAVVVRSKRNAETNLIALGAGTYFRMDEIAVILADNAHPTTAVFSGIGEQADIRFSEPVEYITRAGGNEYLQPRTVEGLVHFAKDQSRHFQQNTVAN